DPGPSRALAWHVLSRVLGVRNQAGRAAEAAARGLGELDPADPRRDILVADRLSAEAVAPRLVERAQDELERLAEATRDGTPPAHPALKVPLMAYLARRGRDLALVPDLARAAVADDPLVDPDARGLAAGEVAGALIMVDELDLADDLLEAALTRARELGDPVAEAVLRCFSAAVAMHRGRITYAEEMLASVTAIQAEGWDRYAGLAALVGVRTALARRDVQAAEYALARGQATAGDDPLLLISRGWVEYTRGESGPALDSFTAAGERLEGALGVANPALAPWRSLAALSANRLGDTDRAAELAGEAVERAREVAVRRALGFALNVAGVIARDEGGLALLTEAVEVLAKSPSRLEHARALLDLGAALRRAGRRADARGYLERALEMAEDFGASAISDRARDELSAAGTRRRGGAQTGLDALTPSERRVAELAAEGLTSPDIAARLFVSRRTIETHLARCYRKLEIGSRGELADVLEASH
ncbi:MAG TPA: helix-turn-helix transcriptional regulator, partial [Candidatus Dormibacteraeota bacterium]